MQGLGEETRGATERMLRRGRQRASKVRRFEKFPRTVKNKERRRRERRRRRSGGRATETRKNSPGTGNEWKLESGREKGEKKRGEDRGRRSSSAREGWDV